MGRAKLLPSLSRADKRKVGGGQASHVTRGIN